MYASHLHRQSPTGQAAPLRLATSGLRRRARIAADQRRVTEAVHSWPLICDRSSAPEAYASGLCSSI